MSPRSASSRTAAAKRARTVGLKAEALVEEHFVRLGWMPLARNHVCRGGELDLVLRAGETVVVVEVKRRRAGAIVEPLASITPLKQRRIVRAALDYITRAGLSDAPIRFDVVAVTSAPRAAPHLEHLEAAFDASSLEDGS